ncbi:AAA family ATPase [Variovorax soli]|jgi:pilus assembly protein CpaE|uniref:AAA family ATPase n=1 Tax=Variovorax soli TaxID=376815 RepID=UPI0008397149|nr:AAA family ATPase [Variovorax soli]
MKIALISPNPHHLQDLQLSLESQGHSVQSFEGGKSRMAPVAEQSRPDLMLVDGMCCDPHELELVEQVTSSHPEIAVLLMCARQTPEFLLQAMRVGVREVLPSPVPPEALQAALARVAARIATRQPAAPKGDGRNSGGAGQVIAFVPCKGGSGATFIASNLACLLAADQQRVLLIDLNLQFGDALSFVSDAKATTTLADLAGSIDRLDASLLAASTIKADAGFSVLAAPEDLSRAAEVKAEHIDAILRLAATQFDFVLVDLPLGLNALSIRALDRAQRIFAVLQPGLPYLRNANKLMQAFQSLGYPPARVEAIVNRLEKNSDIGLSEVRRLLGNVELHTLPDAPRDVSLSINRGVPLASLSKSHPVSRSLDDLAQRINPREEGSPSLLGRLFRRA